MGYLLDKRMSEESVALRTIQKINLKLKFLYRKTWLLTPELQQLLGIAIIQYIVIMHVLHGTQI